MYISLYTLLLTTEARKIFQRNHINNLNNREGEEIHKANYIFLFPGKAPGGVSRVETNFKD